MNALDVSRWLWDFCLAASVLLAAALLVGVFVSQPARRMALAWAVVGGLLALMLLTMIPNWSRYSLASPAPSKPAWTAELEPVLGPAIQRTAVSAAEPSAPQVTSEGVVTTAVTQIVVIGWGILACGALLIGSGTVVVWLLVGAWQVRRLRTRAEVVPAEVANMLGGLAPRSSIQLAVSNELPVPVAVGLRSPCILLPRALATSANREQLRSVLAHELAHIEHRDLWLLALLRLLMIVLWPHPLFWLLRRRVRRDQEILADTAAAAHSSRADYAEQLVALARSAVETRVPRLASSVGLWERRTQLTERVKLLLDEKLTILRSCSRRWRIGSAGVLAALSVGLSLVTLSPAETKTPQPAEKANHEVGETSTDDDFRTMEVRITDEAGEPLAGAKLHVSIWYTKDYRGTKDPNNGYVADSQGVVNVRLPRRLHILRLWPSKPGYVPEFTNFTKGSHQEGLLIPDRYEFGLAEGSTLGGTVVDDEGKPVSGAKVDVSVRVDEPLWDVDPKPMISTWLTDEDFNDGSAITDQQGRWSIDDAPPPSEARDYEFQLKISHPDFAGDSKFGDLQSQQQITTKALRAGSAKIVLSRGKEVKGVVVDTAGKPVTDGYVIWGYHPYSGDQKQFETRLDAAGSFVTKPLSLGEHAFTVIAPGFAAEQRMVNVESSTPDLRFELKPGKRLIVKVVDPDGKPIPNAYFHVGSWSSVEEAFNVGQSSSILHTRIPKNGGRDGVYEWDGAPADAITFQISARDFAAKTVSLTATDAEHVVELLPALVVYGKVTDAVTGKPLETFDVVPLYQGGLGLLTEWKLGTVTGKNGRYEIRLDTISDYHKSYMLRFEANGYQLKLPDRRFNVTDGRVEFDVKLEPREKLDSPAGRRNAEYEDAVFEAEPSLRER